MNYIMMVVIKTKLYIIYIGDIRHNIISIYLNKSSVNCKF